MSQDARNSICLWAASLAVFGFLWADMSFGLLPEIPEGWVWPIFGIIVLMNVAGEIVGYLARRRAARSGDGTSR